MSDSFLKSETSSKHGKSSQAKQLNKELVSLVRQNERLNFDEIPELKTLILNNVQQIVQSQAMQAEIQQKAAETATATAKEQVDDYMKNYKKYVGDKQAQVLNTTSSFISETGGLERANRASLKKQKQTVNKEIEELKTLHKQETQQASELDNYLRELNPAEMKAEIEEQRQTLNDNKKVLWGGIAIGTFVGVIFGLLCAFIFF